MLMKKTILSTNIPKIQLGQRLDKMIVNILKKKYSRSCVKKWILDNLVKIDGCIINKPKKKIISGKKIDIKIFSVKTPNILTPQNIKLKIIYEDKDIIIINKHDGIVVHPGIGNSEKTVLNAIIYHYPDNIYLPRAGIIHRLDKNTTGLMMIAKNMHSYFFLKDMLKQRKIKREYEAIIIGVLKKNGVINAPIKRHIKKRLKMMVHTKGKEAITHYEIIENFSYHSHIKLNLKTGRTHQIRVHMSYINHFLVGDQLYKSKKFQRNSIPNALLNTINFFNRQALHATKLILTHPNNGNIVTYQVSIPEDMKQLLYILKNYSMIK